MVGRTLVLYNEIYMAARYAAALAAAVVAVLLLLAVYLVSSAGTRTPRKVSERHERERKQRIDELRLLVHERAWRTALDEVIVIHTILHNELRKDA